MLTVDHFESHAGDDALEQAEAKFRTLVEQLPAIVWTATLDGRTTYVSPQVEEILGIKVQTWIDDPKAWTRQIHPEDHGRVLATMAQAQADGGKYRCEYRFVRADGRVVWVLDEGSVVRDGEGQPAGIQGVALDITERKLAEQTLVARTREIETLHRISEIVRTGRPLDDIYFEITAEVETALGFPQSAIVLYDEKAGRLVNKGARGFPRGAGLEAGLDDTFSGIVLRTGRPFVWTGAEPLPGPRPTATLSRETLAFLGVPMMVGDRIIGALCIGDRVARPIDARLVPLATSIANHVATVIEHARTREALQTSERHFHAAFDTALDAIVVVDDNRAYVAANPAAARLFGLPVERLLEQRLGDFAPAGTDIEATWNAMIEGRITAGEWRLVRPFGEPVDVEYAFTMNFVPGRHLAVVRDVTERKREDAARLVRSAALEAVGSGIVITDAEGRIEWTNPEFTRISGYALDEIRGLTPRVLKSGRHDAAFYARLWAMIRSGQVWRGSLINRRKDGTVYFEEQSITPVRTSANPDSPITHFVAVKQDVSERRQAEEALRRSRGVPPRAPRQRPGPHRGHRRRGDRPLRQPFGRADPRVPAGRDGGEQHAGTPASGRPAPADRAPAHGPDGAGLHHLARVPPPPPGRHLPDHRGGGQQPAPPSRRGRHHRQRPRRDRAPAG